ncbi:ATP-binding protein [Streptomyces sp. NPDC093109]|uniref:ATP-binding protein n=1 Tax=Streptomyces sp. NPDC093109 TaxID=3154977 RepID=UPI00344F3630
MASVAGIERELRLSLTVRPAELGRIRRDLLERLDAWGYAAVRDDAVLVVTELLTNVHQHAGGRCDLLVRPAEPGPEPGLLLITVSDPVMVAPSRRKAHKAPGTAEDGRGLVLIDALTEHWETVLTATGKDIRCVMRVPPPLPHNGVDPCPSTHAPSSKS